MSKQKQWLGVRAKQAKPTRHHRVAMFEVLLGTVAAVNAKGELKIFDYNYNAAKEWAGIGKSKDIRICRYQQSWMSKCATPYLWPYGPNQSQQVLFVETERV